eukprot:gene4154-6506_t
MDRNRIPNSSSAHTLESFRTQWLNELQQLTPNSINTETHQQRHISEQIRERPTELSEDIFTQVNKGVDQDYFTVKHSLKLQDESLSNVTNTDMQSEIREPAPLFTIRISTESNSCNDGKRYIEKTQRQTSLNVQKISNKDTDDDGMPPILTNAKKRSKDIFSANWQSSFSRNFNKKRDTSKSAVSICSQSLSSPPPPPPPPLISASNIPAQDRAPLEGKIRHNTNITRPQNKYVRMLIDDINDEITDPLFDNLLPIEVAELVFLYLDIETLGRCTCVSKAWQRTADSNRIWRAYAQRHGISDEPIEKRDNWKAFVRQHILDLRLKQQRWRELQAAFINLHEPSCIPEVRAVHYTSRGISVGCTDGSVRFYPRDNLSRSRLIDLSVQPRGISCVSHNDNMMVAGSHCGIVMGWDQGFESVFALQGPCPVSRIALQQRLGGDFDNLIIAYNKELAVVTNDNLADRVSRWPSAMQQTSDSTSSPGDHQQANIPSNIEFQLPQDQTTSEWGFMRRSYQFDSRITHMCGLISEPSHIAVMTAKSLDIIATSTMRMVHQLHTMSPETNQRCHSLGVHGSTIAYIVSQPGQWTGTMVDANTGVAIGMHNQFRHSLEGLYLFSGGDCKSQYSQSNDHCSPTLSPYQIQLALAGSGGVNFCDPRCHQTSQHISTPGFLCKDVRVQDWRVVVCGRFTCSFGSEPAFGTVLLDRRMGKRLWFVRQHAPVRFLEMDNNTIVYGTHRYSINYEEEAHFNFHHRRLQEFYSQSYLNVLDFASPLSSLADAECPFSSRYDDVHGYNYNIALETPFDDIEPYRLG